MRIDQNLGKHGHQSASQIKEEVSAAPHRVFDLRAEGPQQNQLLSLFLYRSPIGSQPLLATEGSNANSELEKNSLDHDARSYELLT